MGTKYGISVACKTDTLNGLPLQISCSIYDVLTLQLLETREFFAEYEPSRYTFKDKKDRTIWENNAVSSDIAFNKLYKMISRLADKKQRSVEFLAHNVDFEMRILENFADDCGYDRDALTAFFAPNPVRVSEIGQFLNRVVVTANMPNGIPYYDTESDLPKTTLEVMKLSHGIDFVGSKSEVQLEIYRSIVIDLARDLQNAVSGNNAIPKKDKLKPCPECDAITYNGNFCWLCGYKCD